MASEDVDPAADFIAREQNVLAEIGNDIEFKSETSTTDTNHFDGQENGEDEATPPAMADDLVNNVSSANLSSSGNLDNGGQVNGGDKEPVKEPEKIRKWREEQQKMLKQKDEEEVKKKKELGEQAKKELDEWYARYGEQLNKSKVINRNAEKEWIAERDAESPGQDWEKITRMCDFNPKASRNSKDTSRMRSILLQLKQQQGQEKSS